MHLRTNVLMTDIDYIKGNEVVKLLQAGNENAYNIIYKNYYRGLCAFASQYVPASECEEIVQDAMMWLWENKATLIPEIPLKGLLFTIVKNKCLNSVSHTQVRYKVHSSIYNKFEEQFEDPDFYVCNELLDLYDKAVKELPKEYREAFEMNRFGEMTYNEIATKMGISPKTIAYRISQAIKLIRIQLVDFLPFLF